MKPGICSRFERFRKHDHQLVYCRAVLNDNTFDGQIVKG